jgi:membrane protein YdbS with pleckstrin-like domain
MSDQYFVKRGETVKGPLSLKQLQAFLEQKRLKSTDLLGESRSGPWGPVASVYKDIRSGNAPSIANPITEDISPSNAGKSGPHSTRESQDDSESSSYDEYGDYEYGDDEYGDDEYGDDNGTVDVPDEYYDSPAIPISSGRVSSFGDAARRFGTALGHAKAALGDSTSIPEDIAELLATKEKVYYAARPAEIVVRFLAIVTRIVFGVPIVGLILGAIIQMFSDEGRVTTMLFLILCAMVLVGIAALINWLRRVWWRNILFLITSRRVLIKYGVFNRKIRLVPSHNVQTITIDSGVIDRWLGLNKVVFRNSDWFGGIVFTHIDSAEAVRAFGKALGK